MPIEGLVINEPESGIFFMNRNADIAFQRESEFHLTLTIQLIRIQNQIKVDSEIADEMFRKMIYVIEARSDCIKARETSNDLLKTYRQLGMDIQLVILRGIRVVLRRGQGVKYLDYPITLLEEDNALTRSWLLRVRARCVRLRV
ncbi:hypothetical protein Tco_0761945 [Tanacetum coccineum]